MIAFFARIFNLKRNFPVYFYQLLCTFLRVDTKRDMQHDTILRHSVHAEIKFGGSNLLKTQYAGKLD